MKRLFFILFIVVGSVLIAKSQTPTDTTYWKKGGTFNINFTQVSLTNWAAGGQNSFAGVSKLNLFANYKKDKLSWDNTVDLGYGLSKTEELVQKNEDIIDLVSKLGLKASKKWNYSAALSFNSQFAPGYDDDSVKTSNLFSPAYLILSFGMDYKPSDVFSLLLSPLTGKMTIVADKDIDATTYGLATTDATIRMELGASLDATLKTSIAKNVGLTSVLSLFSNYLNNPQNIDVDWKVGIDMKINDYLSAQIDTQLLYDADVITEGSDKAKIQFKEILGIGLSFKF